MDPEASSTRKRAISGTASDGPTSDHAKRLKSLWEEKTEPRSVEDLVEDNALLKSQLAQLLDFVDVKHIAADSPPSLRPLIISRLGPKSLAKSLLKRMATVVSPLFTKAYHHKRTGVSNDDIARAMSRFIAPIRDIAEIDHPDSLPQAYLLAFQLRALWFNEASVSYEIDGCSDYDPDLDALITDLIIKRKEAGHCWAWKAELERLDKEAQTRADMGTQRWLLKARQALKELVDERGPGEENTTPATDRAHHTWVIDFGLLGELEQSEDLGRRYW